jgi:hypothetical protein
VTESDDAARIHPRTAALMARVRAAEDADGHLAMPDMSGWDIFPFEGDIRVARLQDPVLPEPPRTGEGERPCESCEAGLDRALWADDRWKLIAVGPASITQVLLCPIEHLDYPDLDDAMAAELGVLSVRLDRVLTALGGIGRVHVMKIGDGGAHLHVWFCARPEGVLQMRGSSLVDWSDCIPPMPQDEWDAVLDEVAAGMAAAGGRNLRTQQV